MKRILLALFAFSLPSPAAADEWSILYRHSSSIADLSPAGIDDRSFGHQSLFRGMAEGNIGSGFEYEFNGIAAHGVSSTNIPAAPTEGIERSNLLFRSAADEPGKRSELSIDRIILGYRNGPVRITIGRQPLNLASTFTFRPNDLFAPFGETQFYRIYKPGVDAARIEYRVGMFTQLSLIWVEGYSRDIDSPSGWSRNPNKDRRSHLIRGSTAVGRFDLSAFGGTVRGDRIVGIGVQGELPFKEVGIRIGGHWREPKDPNDPSVAEWAIGLTKRMTPDLELSAEYFSHGAGADRKIDYDPTARQKGREYASVGGGYQLSPLWSMQGSIIANLSDDSLYGSLYLTLSTSDESEVSMQFSSPVDQDRSGSLPGEYDLLPKVASIEFRAYF